MSVMRQQHWNDYIVKLLCDRRTDQVELNFGVSCYRLTANLIMPWPYNKPISIVCEAYIFDKRKQNAYHNMCFLIVTKVPKPLKNRSQYCDPVSTLAAQLSWSMLFSIVGMQHQSGRCLKSSCLEIFKPGASNTRTRMLEVVKGSTIVCFDRIYVLLIVMEVCIMTFLS